MLSTDASFDPHVYPEPSRLTNVQWQKLSRTWSRLLRSSFAQEAPGVLAPLVVLAERSGIAAHRTDRAIFTILQRMARSRTTFWRWSQEEWTALLSGKAESRPYLAAVAYHFGRLREPVMFAKPGLYAEAIFGSDLFSHELSRLRVVLRSLGYAEAHLQNVLPATLGHLMLENGNPRLESLNVELLLRGQAHRIEGVARSVGKISNGLAALGILG